MSLSIVRALPYLPGQHPLAQLQGCVDEPGQMQS